MSHTRYNSEFRPMPRTKLFPQLKSHMRYTIHRAQDKDSAKLFRDHISRYQYYLDKYTV